MKQHKDMKDLLEEVRIPAGQVDLEGTLDLPAGYGCIVLFAHGSGSSRFSPRNRFVAKKLSDRGIGTLTVAQYLVGRPVKLTLSFEAQGRRTRRPAQTGDIVAEVETEKADIDVEIFVEAGEARSPAPRPVVERVRMLGVNIATLHGTGPGGAITREDVEQAAASRPSEKPAPSRNTSNREIPTRAQEWPPSTCRRGL
jgi:hypothetical protein